MEHTEDTERGNVSEDPNRLRRLLKKAA